MFLIDCKLKEPGKIKFHIVRNESIAEEGMKMDCQINLNPLEKQGEIARGETLIVPSSGVQSEQPPFQNENRVFGVIYPNFDFSLVNSSFAAISPADVPVERFLGDRIYQMDEHWNQNFKKGEQDGN